MLLAAIILAQTAIPTYVPADTTIAILPMINLSGDKFEKMKADQIKEGNETSERLFTERGFKVIPAEESAKAVVDSGIDLTDEENQKRDPLYKIGDLTKANLVMFTVITATSQKDSPGLFMDKTEGFATLKTWLLDVKTHTAILSASVKEGVSSRNGPTGSMRQVRAVRLGMEKQLEIFFKPYPKIKKR